MCLERVPFSEQNNEDIVKHITTVHSAVDCSLEKLTQLCKEAENKQEREGWDFNDVIEEERKMREAEQGKRNEKVNESELGNDTTRITCLICQDKLICTNKKEFEKHLENYHKVIFGIKMLKESDENDFGATEDTYV